MEKRLPLALFLALLVLVAWNLLNPPQPPSRPAGEARDAEAPAGRPDAPAPDEVAEPAGPEPALAAEEEVEETLVFGRPGERGHYLARFSNRGARLVELRTGAFHLRPDLTPEERADPAFWTRLLVPVETREGTTGSLLLEPGPSGRPLAPDGLSGALWRMEVLRDGLGEPRGVEFTYGPGTGVVFTKRVLRVPDTWTFAVELGIENESAPGGGTEVEFRLTPAGCMPAELGDKFYAEPVAAAIGLEGGREYELRTQPAPSAKDRSGNLVVPRPLVSAGAYNKYFAFMLKGEDERGAASLRDARWRRVDGFPPDREVMQAYVDQAPGETSRFAAADLHLALRLPEQGSTASWRYTAFAGPKDPSVLERHPELFSIRDEDLGFFATIGRALLTALRFFEGLTGNWGYAIILLTVCVRIVLFPLNRRSQTAMARYQTKMKRVQPKIEELKKKFEKDPKKLREAQAKLMQEEGAFPPLGGCLPIFLQIPIFFGLFSALRTSFDLRQAPFAGWIHDLSQPDRLAYLGWPLVEWLNLLPILMVVLWVLQQMGMPKPADEQAARMQKMMMFMPILMGVFLYGYAAGLSLYVITQSALGIVEQRVIKKVWPVDETEPVKKARRGCGPFKGILESLAEKQREEMRRVEARRKGQAPPARGQKKNPKQKRWL